MGNSRVLIAGLTKVYLTLKSFALFIQEVFRPETDDDFLLKKEKKTLVGFFFSGVEFSCKGVANLPY
ncbi:hypothetical protein HHUSO_G23094 [Huso huso]|uniref:Uncharacterized protein n=1 Tax=Huso huso TaxID=61971 RepID=A0ABR0YVX5_HUSHU